MKDESNAFWGARIERGKIVAAENGKYTVESYDRAGIVAEGLTANETIAENVNVYFFVFEDGTGKIIARM